MTLSVYESTSIDVSSTNYAEDKYKLLECHLYSRLNRQPGRSWLQQNARLLALHVSLYIAASYPPCVTFHFPWHNSTNAASSSSCRATIDDSYKEFIAPIQVQMLLAVAGLPCCHYNYATTQTDRGDASCTCCVSKVQSIFISGIKSYSVVPVFRSSVFSSI